MKLKPMSKEDLHFCNLTRFIETARDNQEPGSQLYKEWDAVLEGVYDYEELVRLGLKQAA